ncbi:MAG: HEAT repeat domain-containing protein [Gemmatimonadota bacterium]
MPRRTQFISALALTVAVAGSAHAQATHVKSSEPSFDGRSLSLWIKDLKAAAPVTRNAAAYAISSMGPDAKAAVPALIDALSDDEATVRFPVAVALREIGPSAAAAVPALEKALDDRNDDVAFMAKKALQKIKPDAEIP